LKILIISADGFEDSELLAPQRRMKEEGIDVDIASLVRGPIKGKHGFEVEAHLGIDEVRQQDYDALILPGGKAPATLRKSRAVLEVVRAFFDAGKPISAICHGPQVLISAGVLTGRSATCYATVAKELRAAGAHYQNSDVVVDGNIVTSRQPADLPAFLRETVKELREWQTRARGPDDTAVRDTASRQAS
jgi:protease I